MSRQQVAAAGIRRAKTLTSAGIGTAVPAQRVNARVRGDMQTRTQVALREGAHLRLDEGACLPLRSRFGQCRACESACPAGVLHVSVERIALADGCTRCGRCAAACPNEALQIDGFDALAKLPAGREPVELECAKVPEEVRSDQAVVVSCLGGLSAGRLAELNERAGTRGVRVVDRGWCSRCSSGCGDRHPALAAIETVRLWLDCLAGARNDGVRAPQLVARHLPADSMPADIPSPPTTEDPGPPLTRRQFFRAVVENPVGRPRTPMGGNGRAAFPASERRESPERRRLLAALQAAADRRASSVPAEFFPRVAAAGHCVDHRVCTAACPTAALTVVADGSESSLRFSGAACIGCGACVRACPEGALSLEPHGGDAAPIVLASHRQQACAACGETFSPTADETVCLACAKSRRFIGDAMSQLYGPRH
jgi:Fe-S-cluster-containing hydrogenase component 2